MSGACSGHLESNGSVALGFSYPAATNGLIFFKQGESFYVFLYLSGLGTIQSVSVTTQGFNGSVVAPYLPLSIDNYTDPTVVILQVTAEHCCFNGTVNFTVNATASIMSRVFDRKLKIESGKWNAIK